MPSNVLVAGPAGSGKTQRLRELLAESPEPMVVADFTALFNAVRLVERLPDGTFPVRGPADDVYLPIAEAMRLVAIDQARERGLRVATSSSDGDPDRRAALLERLGPDSVEEIVDPGPEIIRARLANPQTGELSPECGQAIGRWYTRLRR